jgi:hypothetical protein
MSRVTPDEVKTVVKSSLDDPVIQVWIDAANVIVSSNSECIGGAEPVLTQVELFLACHFVAMLDPELRGFVTKEKLDVFETTYSNPVSMKNNIDNTPWGTTANMLSGGCLTSTSDKVANVTFG